MLLLLKIHQTIGVRKLPNVMRNQNVKPDQNVRQNQNVKSNLNAIRNGDVAVTIVKFGVAVTIVKYGEAVTIVKYDEAETVIIIDVMKDVATAEVIVAVIAEVIVAVIVAVIGDVLVTQTVEVKFVVATDHHRMVAAGVQPEHVTKKSSAVRNHQLKVSDTFSFNNNQLNESFKSVQFQTEIHTEQMIFKRKLSVLVSEPQEEEWINVRRK